MPVNDLSGDVRDLTKRVAELEGLVGELAAALRTVLRGGGPDMDSARATADKVSKQYS